MVTLIALKEGIQHPAFGVAVTLAFIVMLDASSLRKQVGKQAAAINKLSQPFDDGQSRLRERMGHTRIEILAGAITGAGVASLIVALQMGIV